MQRKLLDLSQLKYGNLFFKHFTILQYYLHWIQKYLYFKYLRHCILDEVDRMLDMGFQDSVEEILAASYTTGSILNYHTKSCLSVGK
jgi:hypothetical protein